MTPGGGGILEGMPDPRDLRRAEHDGMTFICAGSALLACYPSGDAGMRNVAVAVLRQLGFGGRAVAAVMGLTENYVATLHNRALREGTSGLVRERGPPGKLAPPDREQAAPWRAEGALGRGPAGAGGWDVGGGRAPAPGGGAGGGGGRPRPRRGGGGGRARRSPPPAGGGAARGGRRPPPAGGPAGRPSARIRWR